jgi:anthranilate synthase component 1
MIQLQKLTRDFIIKTIHGERFTPMSLCKKFSAKVLLESAAFGVGRGRYSILLIKAAFSLFQKGPRFFIERDGRTVQLKTGARDILDVLLYFANQHRDHDVPFPLPAGGAGYLSYEYARHFDDFRLSDKNEPLGLPDALFIFGHLFLVFDHYSDTISILGLNYKEHRIDLEKAVQDVEHRLHDLDFNYLKPVQKQYECVALVSEKGRERFLKGVQQVRKEIIKGNLLQGVLSRRLALRTEMPALEAYRRLRSLNPSPYMFYFDYGRFQLFGSSPEVHVKVEDARVTMRPIAGTRKRGNDKEEDRMLEKELLADEKERAEHLMLVDLARNDLGRFCVPGSVEVTEFMSIERYSHVMHIVSQVEGDLYSKTCGIEAVRKTFPAGTVSGAPKIRAFEIIDSLEPERRSFYAGIVGYVEPGGTLDSCITIRSGLKLDDLLVLQAGAGIVYDSIPDREYEETSSKLRALGKSIGVEV